MDFDGLAQDCSNSSTTDCGNSSLGLGYKEISMLKSMLVNKDFPTWHPIGWQHSHHVRKFLLTNMEFNMDNPGPCVIA